MTEVVQLPRRVLMRDPALPHQIVIGYVPGSTTNDIYVSCNCKAERAANGGRPHRYEPLESRTRWEPDEILAAYRAHLPQEAS